MKLYRFRVGSSRTHLPHIALCAHRPNPVSFCHYVFGPLSPQLLTSHFPSPQSTQNPALHSKYQSSEMDPQGLGGSYTTSEVSHSGSLRETIAGQRGTPPHSDLENTCYSTGSLKDSLRTPKVQPPLNLGIRIGIEMEGEE